MQTPQKPENMAKPIIHLLSMSQNFESNKHDGDLQQNPIAYS